MDKEKKYTLEETIQNYYNAMNGSWDENDHQMLAWLEELRDLRAIIKKRAPGEEEAEKIEAKGGEPEWGDDPVTLDYYLASIIDYYIELPAEKEVYHWAKSLYEARERIGEDA